MGVGSSSYTKAWILSHHPKTKEKGVGGRQGVEEGEKERDWCQSKESDSQPLDLLT